MPEKVNFSEQEWKTKLSPEQYHICRERGTEAPFTGQYLDLHEDGSFRCVACGNLLFRSGTKFESGTGWPSFYDAEPGAVEQFEDLSHGMRRTEVRCARCGAHLGHLFPDGPRPTGMR